MQGEPRARLCPFNHTKAAIIKKSINEVSIKGQYPSSFEIFKGHVLPQGSTVEVYIWIGLQIFLVSIFHPDRKESGLLKSSEGFRVTTPFPPMEWSHVSWIVFPRSQYLKILSNLLLSLAPTTPVGKVIIRNLKDIYHHSCKVSITLKRQDCFSTFYWGSLNGAFILGMWNFTRLLCACTRYNAPSTHC